jgi:hypothetical protein
MNKTIYVNYKKNEKITIKNKDFHNILNRKT